MISKHLISNALEKSVRTALNTLLLTTAGFHLLIIKRRQCSALHSFLKPHWNFEWTMSKGFDSCLQISISNIFEISGRMLTDLSLFFQFLWVLNAVAMFANLKKYQNLMNLLLCYIKDKYIPQKILHFSLKFLQGYLGLWRLY